MQRFSPVFMMFVLIGICTNLQAKKSNEVSKAADVTISTGTPEVSVPGTENNRVVVSVPGMVCQMCVHGMRKVFKDSVQNAERDVQVDLGNKTVTLNLITALSDTEIEKRVVQAGYKADKIQRL